MNAVKTVKVWDLLLRVFHWSLVLFFVISYATGEEESSIHAWSGYAIAFLLTFRLIWGFVGPTHARFSDFIYSPAEIFAYAKGLMTGNAKRYLGHNPLGGLMVLALLFSLSATVVSGLMLYGAEEGKGPLAGMMSADSQVVLPQIINSAHADDDDDDDEYESRGDNYGSIHREEDDEEHELLEETHELFANFTVFLIFFHIIGVFVESLFHRESLVRAMFNGNKQVEG